MGGSEIGKKIVLGISLFFILSFLIRSVSEYASLQGKIEEEKSFKQFYERSFGTSGYTLMDAEIERCKKEQTKWIIIALILGGMAILCLYELTKKS
uniref:Uncharacterized protein n=1 Tax=candidate division WOR-3 bacterium TaxID=2052148 RepID=A0A7C3UQY3_UNCW3